MEENINISVGKRTINVNLYESINSAVNYIVSYNIHLNDTSDEKSYQTIISIIHPSTKELIGESCYYTNTKEDDILNMNVYVLYTLVKDYLPKSTIVIINNFLGLVVMDYIISAPDGCSLFVYCARKYIDTHEISDKLYYTIKDNKKSYGIDFTKSLHDELKSNYLSDVINNVWCVDKSKKMMLDISEMNAKPNKILSYNNNELCTYLIGVYALDTLNNKFNNGGSKMNFSEALEKVKSGEKIFRHGWNGKGMFAVYQKGYPEGIPCNKQTAEAWGMQEGDLFKCDPYLQIKTTDGSHAMWVPSIRDILADDWDYIH